HLCVRKVSRLGAFSKTSEPERQREGHGYSSLALGLGNRSIDVCQSTENGRGSRQIEQHDLRCFLAADLQMRFVADREAVACLGCLIVNPDSASQDLQPGLSPGHHRMAHR